MYRCCSCSRWPTTKYRGTARRPPLTTPAPIRCVSDRSVCVDSLESLSVHHLPPLIWLTDNAYECQREIRPSIFRSEVRNNISQSWKWSSGDVLALRDVASRVSVACFCTFIDCDFNARNRQLLIVLCDTKDVTLALRAERQSARMSEIKM